MATPSLSHSKSVDLGIQRALGPRSSTSTGGRKHHGTDGDINNNSVSFGPFGEGSISTLAFEGREPPGGIIGISGPTTKGKGLFTLSHKEEQQRRALLASQQRQRAKQQQQSRRGKSPTVGDDHSSVVSSSKRRASSPFRDRPILSKQHSSSFFNHKRRQSVMQNNNSPSFARDTSKAPRASFIKAHHQHIEDAKMFLVKDADVGRDVVKKLLPTLHHVDKDHRDELNEDFKTLRRFDYDRTVKQNYGNLQQHAVGGLHWEENIRPHEQVGKHKVKKSLPMLDFSYCDLIRPDELATAKPRGGKQVKEKDESELEGGGPKLDGQNTVGKPSKASTLFSGNGGNNGMVVIRERGETYAFDANAEGAPKVNKFDAMFFDLDDLKPKDDIIANRYEAQHCRLSNNYFTKLDSQFRLTLSQMLMTQLVVLDLSFNEISTIGSDFLVDEKQTVTDDHGNTLPTKEFLYEKASAAKTAEGVLAPMRKDKISGKVVSRYLRRSALTSEAGAALIFAVLTKLYLHGNKLHDAMELFKLIPLAPSLQHLTSHGNDNVDRQLAANPQLKKSLFNSFPNLVSFNFTTLSPDSL